MGFNVFIFRKKEICAQFAFRSWASMYKAVGCHIYAELLKTFLGDKVRKNKV